MWQTKTGLPAPTYRPTRWWLKWEVIKQLHDTFGDIPSFVEDEDLPTSTLKLKEIIDDPPKNRKLQVELAMTVDVGEPLVKATYQLEGDGPLVLSAYEEIAAHCVAISHQYYPNTNAVATKLSSNRSNFKQQLLYYGKCVQAAYEYFNQKFYIEVLH